MAAESAVEDGSGGMISISKFGMVTVASSPRVWASAAGVKVVLVRSKQGRGDS